MRTQDARTVENTLVIWTVQSSLRPQQNNTEDYLFSNKHISLSKACYTTCLILLFKDNLFICLGSPNYKKSWNMHHKVRLHIHQKMTAGQTPAAIPHSQRGGAHSSCYSFLGWHPLGKSQNQRKSYLQHAPASFWNTEGKSVTPCQSPSKLLCVCWLGNIKL